MHDVGKVRTSERADCRLSDRPSVSHEASPPGLRIETLIQLVNGRNVTLTIPA
jgi:hypothetical protein